MSEIRTTKIDGQEFVTLTDYLRLKEEKQELEYLWDINEELKEENKKLREEVKDLVERNIELDKKYMLVLTENRKLKEELNEWVNGAVNSLRETPELLNHN